VTETVVAFGEQRRLVGTLSLPDRVERDAIAVLLPNTGLEHRVGPNRLHVYLARALAEAGFPTLRFDLSGMGDSTASDTSDPSRDFGTAMDALESRGIARRFAALGLCSGAHDAHRALCTDRRLIAGAFIDGYLFATPRFYLTYAWQRATDPARILRKLSKVLRVGPEADHADRSPVDLDFFRQPTKSEMERDLAAFMARGIVLSYIFTGQVQHRYNYASQMTDAFPELRRYARAEVRYLIMADHTFSQDAMREELAGVLVGWMRTCASVADGQLHRREEPAASLPSSVTGSTERRLEVLRRGVHRVGLFLSTGLLLS
jgi:alpha-beta hydrolase superfamily lysophospholipase